jgi:hypothetical protein
MAHHTSSAARQLPMVTRQRCRRPNLAIYGASAYKINDEKHNYDGQNSTQHGMRAHEMHSVNDGTQHGMRAHEMHSVNDGTQHGTTANGSRRAIAASTMASVASSGCRPTTTAALLSRIKRSVPGKVVVGGGMVAAQHQVASMSSVLAHKHQVVSMSSVLARHRHTNTHDTKTEPSVHTPSGDSRTPHARTRKHDVTYVQCPLATFRQTWRARTRTARGHFVEVPCAASARVCLGAGRQGPRAHQPS